MRLALGFRQQGDKRLLQRLAAGLRLELFGAAGRQHFPGVHRHQPVEALRFFHIGRRHQHAHLRLAPANAVNQLPELGARKRINAGGGLIKDQQLRIVDQGAAQAELLLHPAGQLPGRTVAERGQPGAVQELIDAVLALGSVVTE